MQTLRAIFCLLFVPAFAVAQLPPANNNANNTDWLYKARPAAAEQQDTPPQTNIAPENIGKPKTYDGVTSTLKLVMPIARPFEPEPAPPPSQKPVEQPAPPPVPAAATPEAAPAETERIPIPPPPVHQPKPVETPAPKFPAAQPKAPAKPVKPSKPRDRIKWTNKKSANFNVNTQPRSAGVPTPNLNMKFETIHQVLRKNISWLMAGTSDVYVYQARADFLNYEPDAMSWSGAFFSPSDNCIVLYDDPKDISRIIQQFSHELTHLFFDSFFNPPGKPFNQEPPVWLNEGLAVNMEDISTSPSGGLWARDLVLYNIYRARRPGAAAGELVSSAPLGDDSGYPGGPRMSAKRAYFKNFRDFIKDDSYDNAVAGGYVDDWYFQAYAMVRFLFKPYNATYPEKRMQFEQFSKLLNPAAGKPISIEDALKKAYGFRDAADFEQKFYDWLYPMQKSEREKLIRERRRRR